MATSPADEMLESTLRRARALIDSGANKPALRKMLQEADLALKKRLLKASAGTGGTSMRFSDAQATAFSAQIGVVQAYVSKRLLGLTHEQARIACDAGAKAASKTLTTLNKEFLGIATPLRLREASTLAGVADKAFQPLLSQHATSVDRYGQAMIGEFRGLMRQGLATGVSSGQMVDALVGHGGPKGPKVSLRATVNPVTGKVQRLAEEDIPEGLFVRKRYWAQRIVRTETAHAQNESSLGMIREAAQDFPDMGKKILAILDNRTAPDSLAVHGQVRKIDDLFQDGAGRQYLRPPARPNDRETIVPWRMGFAETPYSAPLPPEQVAEALVSGEPAGEARRLMVEQQTETLRAQQESTAPAVRERVEALIAEKIVKASEIGVQAAQVVEQAAAVAQQQALNLKAQQVLAEATSKADAEVLAAQQAVAMKQTAAQVALAEKMSMAKISASEYKAQQIAAKHGKDKATFGKVLAGMPKMYSAAVGYLRRLRSQDLGVMYRLVVDANHSGAIPKTAAQQIALKLGVKKSVRR